jgi:hypothetical protein
MTTATAQAVLDTFAFVLSADEEITGGGGGGQVEVAKNLTSTINAMGQGLVSDAVVGERPVSLSSAGLHLEAAVLSAEVVSDFSLAGEVVAISDDISAILDGGQATATLVVMDDNLYSYAHEPEGTQTASGIVSFSLFAHDSGEELVVENLRTPMMIKIPHTKIANWSDSRVRGVVPSCWYWTIQGWADDGCVVNFDNTDSPLSNSTQTVCLCDHLTDFNIKVSEFVPTFTVAQASDFRRVQAQNIVDNPIPSLVCLSLLVLYCVLFKIMRQKDRKRAAAPSLSPAERRKSFKQAQTTAAVLVPTQKRFLAPALLAWCGVLEGRILA